MIEHMRIETERLIIRPYKQDDLPECFQLMQDKDLFTYMDMEVMTLEEYKGLFQWLIESYKTGFDGDFKYSFNVIQKVTGAHIGWVGIGGIEYDHSIKEIYWLFGKAHWNKGYASEAAAALLHYAFTTIGLREVIAVCHPENIGSRKVMEHIGLVYQGTVSGLPDAYAYYNGELLYALSKEAYMATLP